MKLRRVLTSLAAAAAVTVLSVQTAVADDGTTGWTREEIIAAATSLGLDETWVQAAIDSGNIDSIPVESTQGSTTELRAPTTQEVATVEARGDVVPLAVVSTSHDQIWYNWLGGALTRITMHKSFDATGVSVSAISDNVTTGSGYGWYFNGVVNSWDAYSTEGGRPNGGHTSYTMGTFCSPNLAGGTDCVNQWVQIKGLWNGTTVKSGG